MEETLEILVPYGYEEPTEEDIVAAKKWTKERNENALLLVLLITNLLKKAIKQLTEIAYKYNCKPEEFQFSQDKNLRESVADVVSKLEADIMDGIKKYSLNATNNQNIIANINKWLDGLHGKDADNLKGTLHNRVRQFLFDTEAQIAAMLIAGYSQTKAITRITSTMHAIYTSPEVLAAFKKLSAARYIKSKGVHEGNVGMSSSGANNVENFGSMTAIMAWSRTQYEEEEEDGKTGYFVFRGSTYPCSLCDSKVGFHSIEDVENIPPYHGHCCCFVVYVNRKTI